MTFRPFNQQRALYAISILASFATSAPAQAVGIVWDESRAFETNAAVASGKSAEVCGKLSKGQVVVWKFEGDRPLDFNIHYHAGAKVVFPEQRGAVSDASGELTVAMDQDYCWMWTNRAGPPARVALKLRLR